EMAYPTSALRILSVTKFEFLRNGAMNSRNFFAPVPDHLKRNQYGGSRGGPIARNRIFFFGTYQGTQVRNISTGNTSFILTTARRGGDFSALTRQLVGALLLYRRQTAATEAIGSILAGTGRTKWKSCLRGAAVAAFVAHLTFLQRRNDDPHDS